MRPYLIFPMILPRPITIHMTNLVLPFAIVHACTDAYLKTLREVLQ